jgi:hypothetical protein
MLIPVIQNGTDLFIDSAQIAIPWSSVFGRPTQINNFSSLPNGSGVLVNDGAGNLSWASIGGGSVTSVGLAAPASFTVTGSPVTGAGTLTFAYAPGYVPYTSMESSKLATIATGATVGATWTGNLSGIPAIINSLGVLANSPGFLLNNGVGGLSWFAPSGFGTVTQVDTGGGTTGGPITNMGTVSVDQNFSFDWTGNHRFAGAFNVGYPGASISTTLVNTVATTYQAGINQLADSAIMQLLLRKHDATANNAPEALFVRARDTGVDSVVDGDALGRIQFGGWHTDSYYLGASIHAEVDGVPGAADMPTRVVIKTSANASATPAERFGVNSFGAISLDAETYGAAGDWMKSGGAGAPTAWTSPAALTKTDDTNVTLTLGGAAATALLNAASLTLGWTGTLAKDRGGFGLDTTTLTGYVKAAGAGAITASATIPYADLTGTPAIPVGANPSALVGLAAVNGAAASFMRSDGAPALDQAIVPTWTGAHVFSSSVELSGAITIGGLAVSIGVADSGGVGFRLLRVPN